VIVITKKYNYTIEGKRNLSESKIGNKNPAKRPEVREKIRQKVLKNYTNPDFKKRVMELSKIGHDNPVTKAKMKLMIPPSQKGLKRSLETRELIRQSAIRQWRTSREILISSILKGLFKRPTSWEKFIVELCNKYNLPFKYVGNGQVIINYVNPDFICTNGQKKIIEVYYSYYHPKNYEEERMRRFEVYGYKTLFLSDKDIDINRSLSEKVCLEKITNFLKEG